MSIAKDSFNWDNSIQTTTGLLGLRSNFLGWLNSGKHLATLNGEMNNSVPNTLNNLVRPKTGDLFERTFNTSKGPVDMLAEIVVEGDTIHLKDVAIFPRTAEPLTGLNKEILAARTQLANDAKQLGFKQLRITGKRVPTGSSANPGKEIDVTIDLTK